MLVMVGNCEIHTKQKTLIWKSWLAAQTIMFVRCSASLGIPAKMGPALSILLQSGPTWPQQDNSDNIARTLITFAMWQQQIEA